ncbi:MAG: membrane protein insertase YidC [Cyclobacteriaceae bacterium]|nr:membrane protein insertase YidC [Cyclobacteriaceae bacterium]
MDKNQATGLLLISLMVMGYFYFYGGPPELVEQPIQTTEQAVTERQPAQLNEASALPDSVQQILNQQQYGDLAAAAKGTSQLITVENTDLRLVFNTKGGVIEEVELKGYKTYTQEPLILVDANSRVQKLIARQNGREVNLYGLFYTVDQKEVNDTIQITFTLTNETGGTLKQHYFIPKTSGFKIDYRVEANGMQGILSNGLTLNWKSDLKATEKDVTTSRVKSTITYYQPDDNFDELSERSTDIENESVSNLSWVNFKQHFFSASVIAPKGFENGNLTTEADENSLIIDKTATASLSIANTALTNGNLELSYYYGPNNYQIMKEVAPGFQENVYLGIIGIDLINKWVVVPIFNWLDNYIASYGLIIFILVLIIKLALSPLSYKSYLSMAKMKVLKPELDEIKAKLGDDQQKFQQEQMKLYQQVGVNPLSGCMPMLLQMPILYAMFSFFPSSIELRQQPFLWADDLSTYDSIMTLPFEIPIYGTHVSLFVILMTISTILYTWSNNQMSTVQGPMKTMSYMMPVIFMFVLNSFPAALSYYYFLSTLITFGQQALIKQYIDEDKILAVLEDNRKKGGKKKSKFMAKLEDAMKASEEAKKAKKK